MALISLKVLSTTPAGFGFANLLKSPAALAGEFSSRLGENCKLSFLGVFGVAPTSKL